MAWKTTKDGRHFNTDWINDDNAKKERQISENKKQADEKNKKPLSKEVNKKQNTKKNIHTIDNMPSHVWGEDTRTNLVPMANEQDIKESNRLYHTIDRKDIKYQNEKVSINKLTTRQDWLDYDKLKDMYNDLTLPISGEQTSYDGGIRVLRYNGKYIVIDGNHRLNVAILKGQKDIIVRVARV